MACVSARPNSNCFSSPSSPASMPSSDHDDTDLEATTDYHVVKELGCGLQGRVELAYDKHQQRLVAIKLPTFETREGTTEVDLRHLDCQVQCIVQERNAMQHVHHNNVLQLIRSMPGHKSHHVYVMLILEYASNGDLFDIISQTGALSEQTCQYYFHQLLRGVQACHAAGVIHRDVKPENILFDETFTLKLCDFGLATTVPVEHIADAELSDVEGTQLYMAPEIDGMAPFKGPPVDLWSCGVVLFIMLTGFPPFELAEIGDASYDWILKDDIAQFWAAQAATMELPSPKAMELIAGLLQVDPAKRMTLDDALSHPWLKEVDQIDSDAVVADMAERRQMCVDDDAE